MSNTFFTKPINYAWLAIYIKKLLVKCDDIVFRLEYIRDIILPKIKAAIQNHFYVDNFI